MDCIAHRGYVASYPENTLTAVTAATETADWIEVDVRRCGSGELVVIHDETVDRVTGASGAVADYSASELAAMDVLGSDDGVPTLADVLAAIPPSVAVDVELKERGIARDAAARIADHDGPALCSSFDADTLREVRAVSEDPIALIGVDDPHRLLEDADDLDCTAVCLHHDAIDSSVVDSAHEGGLAVYAWTIRNEADARVCVEAGLDGLIADAPAFCE